MSFDRTRLPDPTDYYTGTAGLVFRERKGKWRTTACNFHGGRDSMRINTSTGAFCCMAGCGARGGDVLAYHQAEHGQDFTTAAKELGAWIDDGKPAPSRPTPLPARDALALLTAIFENCLSVEELIEAAMRACDHYGDGPAARQEMVQQCLEVPAHLRAELHQHFIRTYGGRGDSASRSPNTASSGAWSWRRGSLRPPGHPCT